MLFGHANGIEIEIDTAYLLLRAHELARSVDAWYQASHFVAEGSVKLDAGIQGRIEGMVYGLKGKVDLNIVKADIFSAKVNLQHPFKADSWEIDHAGKGGKTKISNGVTAQIEVPWVPKTPWGKLAVGLTVEQSQWIDANYGSNGAKQDWGVYAIVPILQPKGLKKLARLLKRTQPLKWLKHLVCRRKKVNKKSFMASTFRVGLHFF